MISLSIILNDPDFLVVEKPEGIPVQPQNQVLPADSVATLAQILAKKFPELKSVGGSDWGAVHRLDIETSGLVIFARNQKTYDYFRKQFSGNKIEKEYTTLVEGILAQPGKINWPIGPDPKSAKRVKVYKNKKEAIRNKAQEAMTFYEPLLLRGRYRSPPETPICTAMNSSLAPFGWPEQVRSSQYSRAMVWDLSSYNTTLLRIQIKTGRRHQIRAHLAALGYPIVGDKIYGSTTSCGRGKKSVRLCLHASRLRFKHPHKNQWVEVFSQNPQFLHPH